MGVPLTLKNKCKIYIKFFVFLNLFKSSGGGGWTKIWSVWWPRKKPSKNEHSGPLGFQNDSKMESKMEPGESRKWSWKPSCIKTSKTQF